MLSSSARCLTEDTPTKAARPAVEDNEEAKICAVENRLSLQSSFALTVTIPPARPRTPFQSRKHKKDLPPVPLVPNGVVMVTVDVEQIDDTGDRLGEARAAVAQPVATSVDRYSACPPARGSTYFDFEAVPSRSATPRALVASSALLVPSPPKRPQTPRGLVHKLSFARLKLKPAKSKETIRPDRS
ncbi:hypothetical protein AURDEDRAFT_164016 [Auricularia subglabra TFB-10046 SS5]|nr:hypothetical protein AURDEDRAFT_164016 [Auricularia subglabra TFB-10046 SS5]